MTCPPAIAEIICDILYYGLLSARVAGWQGKAELAALQADHLHNLPALLKHYSPELLRFYWEIERPSFIARRTEAGIEKTGFEPLWEKLQLFVEKQNQPALSP